VLTYDWTKNGGQVTYNGWWANPTTHAALFLYALALGTFLCYYMIRNNIVGLIAVFLLCTLLSGMKRHGEPVLQLDTSHSDALGGIGILKEIVLLGYLSVLNSMLSIFLIYCCFGLRRSLFPFYVGFMLLNPAFVLVPVIVIRRQLRWSKTHQLGVLKKELRELMRRNGGALSANTLMCKNHVEDQINKLQRIPGSLFSPQRVLASFIIYYIPVLFFIDRIVQLTAHP